MNDVLDFKREHKAIAFNSQRQIDAYEQDGAVFAWSESNLRYERVPGLIYNGTNLAVKDRESK